ncbi:MAG: HemK2/MTQ2 family protein methyltransferase [Candidatus Micrarchaeia archaeon]
MFYKNIKLNICKDVYEPREDSFMLAEAVEEHAYGRVLDLGSGSGIQGIVAAKKNCIVDFADIDENALKCSKLNAELNIIKAEFIKSDLFSNINKHYDTIIFNPPYLPSINSKNETALDGGENGRVLIEKFLSNYSNYLNSNGISLIVESSFNNYEQDVEKYHAEIIKKEHYFFEDIVVLKLKK